MMRLSGLFGRLIVVAVALVAMVSAPAMGATVWFDDSAWLAAIGAEAGHITWDDVTLDEGEHTTLTSDHYSSLLGHPLLSADAGSGLFVGNPDPTNPSNESGFFGQDFVPVSESNVFSPDLAGSPEGILTITFDQDIYAMGAWFLDVEQDYRHTGIEINGTLYHFPGSQGDDTQSFLGVTAVGPFTEARIHMSSQAGLNGVGIDDVIYAVPIPAAAWAGLVLLGGVAAIRRRVRRA